MDFGVNQERRAKRRSRQSGYWTFTKIITIT